MNLNSGTFGYGIDKQVSADAKVEADGPPCFDYYSFSLMILPTFRATMVNSGMASVFSTYKVPSLSDVSRGNVESFPA